MSGNVRLGFRRSTFFAWFSGVAILFILHFITVGKLTYINDAVERLEFLLYDLRIQHFTVSPSLPGNADNPIVIVDIDENSLQVEGRWPWSRSRLAQLLSRLDEAGAAIVVFDVLFAEAEPNPAILIHDHLGDDEYLFRKRLKDLEATFDSDHVFSQSMENMNVVLGFVFHQASPSKIGSLPSALQLRTPIETDALVLPAMYGYSAPLDNLVQTSSGAGFFSLQPDSDGVIRRAPLIARIDQALYPSLSLETIRQYLFLDQLDLKLSEIASQLHIEGIILDEELVVRTDGKGGMLIPYKGRWPSFPYVSATDVMHGNLSSDLFEGAIVLIGTTAPGLFDLRTTPVGSVFPGVEIHANLIESMLEGRILYEPSWAKGANFLLWFIPGLILALALPLLSPAYQLSITLLFASSLVAMTSWLWIGYGMVFSIAMPLLAVFLIAILNLAWGFLSETRIRYRLKNMFGQYVPPSLVDEMLDDSQKFTFDGRSKELSILFSDIRGFTTISEQLDADELKRFLNEYFTPMTRILFEHRGTIDKYVGDMVMAFWGAPVDDPNHAFHAISAALEMLDETRKISDQFISRGWPAVQIGIGINTGMVNVGDMGSVYRRAYTVIGDPVNLASRLESSCKYYGVDLVVGERTHSMTSEDFIWRELDLVRVKGKSEPVRVFEAICHTQNYSKHNVVELDSHHDALTAFRQKRFEKSRHIFEELARAYPSTRIYKLYLERLDYLSTAPPADDWDGSWNRTDK